MPSIRSLASQFNAFKFITVACYIALFALAACGPGATPSGDAPVTPSPFSTATLMPSPVLTATQPPETPIEAVRATDAPAQGLPAVHLPASAPAAQVGGPSEPDAAQLPTSVPPTATSVPPTLQATVPVTPTFAIPTDFKGDAGKGAALFKSLPCVSCHLKPKQGRMIAPELTHIATDAREIILRPDYHGQAKTAPAYIFESIVDPNAFVLPPYDMLTRDRTSLMPKDFAAKLAPAQLQDLVAYLMTLQ